MPVPLLWSSVSSRFFFDALANSLLVETVKYPIMKHLKTCIAVSLDGFIATKDNELDWMPENVKLEISATYDSRMYYLPE